MEVQQGAKSLAPKVQIATKKGFVAGFPVRDDPKQMTWENRKFNCLWQTSERFIGFINKRWQLNSK